MEQPLASVRLTEATAAAISEFNLVNKNGDANFHFVSVG